MAQQFADDLRDAALDAMYDAAGPSCVLRLRTGAPPANCAAARSGTILATINLPADWMAAASGGDKVKAGTWSTLAALATGDSGHFEIMNSALTVCVNQGTVSQSAASGGTGDLKLDQATAGIVEGQPVTVTAFQWTAGGE